MPAPHWFATPAPRADAEVLLFCFPYAGGGTAAYRRWDALTPPALGVEPVALPGRERRIVEPPGIDPDGIAAALLERAEGRPFALYGHSMGARIGYEVTARLVARGAAPRRLAVGGARPPDEVSEMLKIVDLPDDGFADELVRMGGTPAEVWEHEELRALLLPVLRADFGWLRGLPRDGTPLPVPIDAYAGDADQVAGPLEMAGWDRITSAGFTLRTVPGDHFLIAEPPAQLLGPLAADLLETG